MEWVLEQVKEQFRNELKCEFFYRAYADDIVFIIREKECKRFLQILINVF